MKSSTAIKLNERPAMGRGGGGGGAGGAGRGVGTRIRMYLDWDRVQIKAKPLSNSTLKQISDRNRDYDQKPGDVENVYCGLKRFPGPPRNFYYFATANLKFAHEKCMHVHATPGCTERATSRSPVSNFKVTGAQRFRNEFAYRD
ncbi:hypothetical protein EVAR_24715_1 [Eumeta japonica]|uniref:Uncharacterized protein n=1 Tax=Eumeta variegata TaxID=151549 RepID=A0A4C1VEM8_EUMVA|nr:hypothetical protein EVAR_24715_1 [Eumeta japonica]